MSNQILLSMKNFFQEIWIVIVRWLLKQKTLNSILYILCAFFIKELAAISAGENIQFFAENLKAKHPDSSLIEFFADLLIVLFSSGSKPILIITFATIILFLFVRFFDKINLHPILKAIGFLGLASVVLLSIFNINIDKPKINMVKYEEVLKKIEHKIANEPSAIVQTNSYIEHIKKSNGDFTKFLKEFNDSLSVNSKYNGIAYVTAPAGFGKSYFTKKWLSDELLNAKVGKIKVREDFVCGEIESKCFSDALDYKVSKKADVIAESKNGKKTLGSLYEYQFDLDSIIHFYKYNKGVDVIMVDDLDEVSEVTMKSYLKNFESIIEGRKYPDLNLVVFLSRPEAFVSYLSNTYRKNPKVNRIYGLESKTLQKPVFSTIDQIKHRVNDWADWYEEEKLGRPIEEKEREQILEQVYSLYQKYDFIKLQLQIQSNSDFLLRGIQKKRIDEDTDEEEIKTILFNSMVGRNSDSHLRPMLDSNEGAMYMDFLREIVRTKINIDKIEKNNGWFKVDNNEKVGITLGGVEYTTTVKSLLNRSGLITIDPIDDKFSKYRFEPFWIHRYLVTGIKKTNH